MRAFIAAAAAPLILAACGGPSRIQEAATSVPRRDLTLTTTPATSVQVASRIELATTQTAHHSQPSRPAARARVAPEPETPVAQPAPAAEPVTVPQPAPAPAAVAEAPPPPDPTGRELAPGATVTIIPVSPGPSRVDAGAGGGWSEVPAPRGRGVMIGGHGGDCGGRRGRGPVSILR